MDRLRTCSLNIRGLNFPENRSQILHHMHTKPIHLLFLQETHFRADHVPCLSNHYYNSWYYSTNPQSKSRGVSIGIHKSLPHTLLSEEADAGGRFLFLKISICNTIFTIANLYLPNQNQARAYRAILGRLEDFAEGFLIIGETLISHLTAGWILPWAGVKSLNPI